MRLPLLALVLGLVILGAAFEELKQIVTPIREAVRQSQKAREDRAKVSTTHAVRTAL